MKKIKYILFFVLILLLVGCGKNSSSTIIKKFKNNLKTNSYQLEGTLSIVNNDDVYNYDVKVFYKKDNKYKISLTNQANYHEQIILKNEEGVYVVTPSLNKSFKFQSEWPNTNSQIYLLQSIKNDIEKDKKTTAATNKDNFIITTTVNYPNNKNLVKQKITADKNYNLKEVSVLTKDDVPQMTMKFTKINKKSNITEDEFKLEKIITIDENTKDNKNEDATKENKDDNSAGGSSETGLLDDIIYPLYLPNNTKLTSEETIEITNGRRAILTFEGDKSFILVEETATKENELTVIPTSGEPYMLIDTIGALSDNSVTWTSNGVEYYITSSVMAQNELLEVAKSISVIPTMK